MISLKPNERGRAGDRTRRWVGKRARGQVSELARGQVSELAGSGSRRERRGKWARYEVQRCRGERVAAEARLVSWRVVSESREGRRTRLRRLGFQVAAV
ncbi:hypothetical protein TorRG33x02_067450 [Trema orientale]|uniref:Uncharacterized protein n=1 Tax=Trema orientale TaxID=63057 RepID=A0A2P5FIE5_TREOI|nr:hypothetical protein TorRG33x02_067450 [Trema orientale]